MPKEKKEITPVQTKVPITDDAETNRLFEGEDIEGLVNESPIVSGADVEKDKEMAKKTEEETTEQAEQAKKKETTEKKEEKLDEESQKTEDDKASEKEPDQVKPEKVIIGDREVPPEEVALWESEFNKKKEWEERLSNQSIIAANLNDEEIQASNQIISGERKLPDQSAEVASSIVAEILGDKPVKVKDEKDGYEIDVTDQVKEKMTEAVKATLSRVAPVLDKANKEIISSQRKAVATFISSFMDSHPDYKIVVPEGIPIDQYMDKIERTGPTHPDYMAYTRYRVLSDAAQRMGYVGPESLDKAYTALYGKHDGKVKTAEEKAAEAADAQAKIIEKQEKVTQETTGDQVETKDDITILMDELADPATEALKAIGVNTN